MLTDTKLRSLTPKISPFRVADANGRRRGHRSVTCRVRTPAGCAECFTSAQSSNFEPESSGGVSRPSRASASLRSALTASSTLLASSRSCLGCRWLACSN